VDYSTYEYSVARDTVWLIVKKEQAGVQVKEVLLHWFHQGNQDIHALGFREEECLC